MWEWARETGSFVQAGAIVLGALVLKRGAGLALKTPSRVYPAANYAPQALQAPKMSPGVSGAALRLASFPVFLRRGQVDVCLWWWWGLRYKDLASRYYAEEIFLSSPCWI